MIALIAGAFLGWFIGVFVGRAWHSRERDGDTVARQQASHVDAETALAAEVAALREEVRALRLTLGRGGPFRSAAPVRVEVDEPWAPSEVGRDDFADPSKRRTRGLPSWAGPVPQPKPGYVK